MTYKEIELFGRKTFFIAPEMSLITKSFLEEFMLRGFQTYVINPDYSCSIKNKVNEIIKLYPEAIIYFNIDSNIEEINWKVFIKELQNSLKNNVLLGVLYREKPDSNENSKISDYYENELNLKAGCLSLSGSEQNNFDSIVNYLEKNGARGRRNLVRAKCDSSSYIKFNYKGSDISSPLLDVNLTHFRCDLDLKSENFKIFDKVRNIAVSVNGFNFTTDAVLIMKRVNDNKSLCVFMFIKSDDSPDLESETEKKLNEKIYQMVSTEDSKILQQAFGAAK